MLTVPEAAGAIADVMTPFDTESVNLDRANRRILRQVVPAERDQPPFDRVTMDGIAISFDAFEDGRRAFRIQKWMQRKGCPRGRLEPFQSA